MSDRAEWLLAKYVRDLRRNEPRNVGVILLYDGGAFARFVGQIDGADAIDHELARAVVTGSLEIYEAWVKYWRHAITIGGAIETLLMRRAGDNYYLALGGGHIAGALPVSDKLLAKLYSELVEA